MRFRVRPLVVVGLLMASLGVALVSSAPAPRQKISATAALDRYLRGGFDEVLAELSAKEDFEHLLDQLKRDGEVWVDAGDRSERPRRELAAATFALEAARLGEWTEWKQTQLLAIEGYTYRITFWEAPTRLLEWGCALLRRSAEPGPMERWWQLAAMAVAQRAKDDEFLYGDVNFPGRYSRTTLISPTIKIEHLRHLRERFPNEQRFQIAEAIALEFVDSAHDVATKMFRTLQNDIDVGGEATMRLGAMALRQTITASDARTVLSVGGSSMEPRPVQRQGSIDEALSLFRRAESLTRDPWVLYLSRYLSGRAWEAKNRPAEAEQAYRRAIAVMPRVQSASVSLAVLLFRRDKRAEASELIERMIAADPIPPDPWREYAASDHRFWPELLAHLREEIRR
jgi:tetratricopeptide (TPR) repeat protein